MNSAGIFNVFRLPRNGATGLFRGLLVWLAGRPNLVVIRHVNAEPALSGHLLVARNELVLVVVDSKIERIGWVEINHLKVCIAHRRLAKTSGPPLEREIMAPATTAGHSSLRF